jgi:protein-S-isoprenylcysteine O-methyltransferase Ste14
MRAATSPATDHAPVVLNPLLIYLGLFLLGALLQWILPLPFLAQAPARLIGLVVMLVNLAIGLPAVRAMLRARTSLNPARPVTSLVLSGPYRFTRNPMYLGLTLLFTGLAIIFRLPWALVLVPVVVWLITQWVIVPEERYLEGKFGSQYAEYKSRVRRWL